MVFELRHPGCQPSRVMALWSLLVTSAVPVGKVFILCAAGVLLAHVVRMLKQLCLSSRKYCLPAERSSLLVV